MAKANHPQLSIEVRRTLLSTTVDGLSQQPEWAGLQAVGRVESLRSIGNRRPPLHFRQPVLAVVGVA